MSKMKELFISMQQGLMDGVSIEKQMQRKFKQRNNRISTHKNKKKRS